MLFELQTISVGGDKQLLVWDVESVVVRGQSGDSCLKPWDQNRNRLSDQSAGDVGEAYLAEGPGQVE